MALIACWPFVAENGSRSPAYGEGHQQRMPPSHGTVFGGMNGSSIRRGKPSRDQASGARSDRIMSTCRMPRHRDEVLGTFSAGGNCGVRALIHETCWLMTGEPVRTDSTTSSMARTEISEPRCSSSRPACAERAKRWLLLLDSVANHPSRRRDDLRTLQTRRHAEDQSPCWRRPREGRRDLRYRQPSSPPGGR
jgi:hypothetical protein